MTAAFRSSTPSRQRGSTLTGLIIGLVIGLGIAVAVALTITKGASPFTDKTAKAGRPADPAPGQAADPNKPMYGNRDAAREASRALADKTPRPAAAPSTIPVQPEAKPSDDPLGAAIAGLKDPVERHAPAAPRPAPAAPAAPATPAAPAAAPAGASGDYIYYLQAGAFREMPDAEATRAKLALLGFEAAISDRNSGESVLHRVRIGPFNQVEAMNKARAKLLDSGVDVAIVRNQR